MGAEGTALPKDPLWGPVAKVKRAAEHLDALHGEINPFLKAEPRPFRFVSKVDAETSSYVMRVVIERAPPPRWSLLAGDYVQNLRAALDHLVWRLALANGSTPGRASAFPIFRNVPSNSRERERWNAMTAGLSADVLDFIERCQPYNPAEDGPDTHVLAALARLSNEDKHKTLLPTLAAIQTPAVPFNLDVEWSRDVGPLLEGGHLFVEKPLKTGDPIIHAPVKITGPNPEVRLKGEMPLGIAFGEGRHAVPMKALRQMVDLVAMIVSHSRRFAGIEPGGGVENISIDPM